MAHLWVDPFSGLSGDLWVGGMVALGVPEGELAAVLRQLPFPDLALKVDPVLRCGIQGVKASVVIGGKVDAGLTPHVAPGPGAKKAVFRRKAAGAAHVHGFTWREVDDLLAGHLQGRVAEVARAAFEALGRAEARVHGSPIEQVHFHEVGLKDSLADVALAAAGWVALGEPTVHVGPVATGKGRTRMAHGDYPVPAPAAYYLLEGFECRPGVAPEDKELCTPTGAALAAVLATHRKAPARFIPGKVGFAAGGWDFADSPNVCRFSLGEVPDDGAPLLQMETNVDDATPQQVAYAQARLMAAGALDVWVSAATFKKGRSGWVVGLLVAPSQLEQLAQILVAELPTLGLRTWPVQRLEADRRFEATDVEGNPVAVKEGLWPGTVIRQPEFEDAAGAAKATGRPLREIQARARKRG